MKKSKIKFCKLNNNFLKQKLQTNNLITFRIVKANSFCNSIKIEYKISEISLLFVVTWGRFSWVTHRA